MKYLALLLAFLISACTNAPSTPALDSSLAPQRVIAKDLSASQPISYHQENLQ